ncbi:MAG: polysaccharide deacetylase family protein [Bacteroidales bacterium]|nr:polysaccharide deacetylase family protein [Bacteroidales bacterium]
MLTIYTPCITERITFVMNVVFKTHLGVEYRLTDSADFFAEAPAPKFVYAQEQFHNELFICKNPIMTETEICRQAIEISEYEGEPVFFQAPHPAALLPFDIFAVVFYLISRYEEYLPFEKDRFGRFPATQSLAYKAGCLQKPLADILILKFAEKLQSAFSDFHYQKTKFQYIATYDIDNAYLYKHKGFIRSAGGVCKQLLKGNLKECRERISVLSNAKPDPNDVYAHLRRLQQKFNFSVYYFILFAETDVNDHGLSPKNKHFRSLIRDLQQSGTVGIHPSFASASDAGKLRREIAGLSEVIGKNITCSRSHFLMLRFPETCRNLIRNGITDDFTLGYADQPGFRASTCKPFPFFDLSANQQTTLTLHPFACMDATLKRYLSLSPEQSLPLLCTLIDNVKAVGGTFVSLWHNESFSPSERDWGKLYEDLLEKWVKNDSLIAH